MATMSRDDGERAELMRRLRGLVSKSSADEYEGAALPDLRDTVLSCEAQKGFYASLGLKDAAEAE